MYCISRRGIARVGKCFVGGAFFMSFSSICVWCMNIGYAAAIIPQVVLNYRLKTTSGLSDFYLLGYFIGYVNFLLYAYGLNFSLAYKMVMPFTLSIISLMIFQRFLYKEVCSVKLYILSFSFLAAVTLAFLHYPVVIGKIAGWVAMITFSIYQFPQVLRLYKAKSVYGFSFFLISVIGIGNCLEFIISWALSWPLQSQLIALRGLVYYAIFCVQFWLYSRQ